MSSEDSVVDSTQGIMKCFDVFASITFEYLVSYIAANDCDLYRQVKEHILEFWNASHRADPVSDSQATYLFSSIDKSVSEKSQIQSGVPTLTVWFSSSVVPLGGEVNYNDVKYELIRQSGFSWEIRIIDKKSRSLVKSYTLPTIASLQICLILDHFEAPVIAPSEWGLDGSSTHIEFDYSVGHASYGWWCTVPQEWKPLDVIADVIRTGKSSKDFFSIVLYRKKRRIDLLGYNYFPKCLFCGGNIEKTQKFCPGCGRAILAYTNCSLRAIGESSPPSDAVEHERMSIEELQQIICHEKAYCSSHPSAGKDRFNFMVRYGIRNCKEFENQKDSGIVFDISRVGELVANTALFCLSCYVKETNDWNGCVLALSSAIGDERAYMMRGRFKEALLKCAKRVCNG